MSTGPTSTDPSSTDPHGTGPGATGPGATGAAADEPDYVHWEEVPTRWADNDAYGHVNNVLHYAFMDSVINKWLIDRGGFDYRGGPVVGMCVESHCVYRAETSFPEVLAVGLRVGHLGNSSVRYELGLYRRDRRTLVAEGHFVHVFTDRTTRRPVRIDGRLRTALAELAKG